MVLKGREHIVDLGDRTVDVVGVHQQVGLECRHRDFAKRDTFGESLSGRFGRVGEEPQEKPLGLFAIGRSDVEFTVDTSWSDQGRVETSDVVGRCKEQSAFSGGDTIDGIEESAEGDFAPLVVPFFAFEEGAVDVFHQNDAVDWDRAKEFRDAVVVEVRVPEAQHGDIHLESGRKSDDGRAFSGTWRAVEQVASSVRNPALDIPLTASQERFGILEQIVHESIGQDHRIEWTRQSLHLLHPITLSGAVDRQTQFGFWNSYIASFFDELLSEFSVTRENGDIEALAHVDLLSGTFVGFWAFTMQADQTIAEEEPVDAGGWGKENAGARVDIGIIAPFVVIDRFGFDRQGPGSVFRIGMLGEPFFDPLKRRIPVQNIDLGDHSTADELIDLRGDLAEIRQERSADHEHQSAAEDLVVLQEVR